MFDFLINSITSFFIAIGILSPTVQPALPPVPVFAKPATTTVETLSPAEILAREEEEAARQAQLIQDLIQKKLQREEDLRQARLLREEAAARELESTDTTTTVAKKQPVTTVSTNIATMAARYDALANQYSPLVDGWIVITEGDSVATLANVANERIIRIRSIDFFAENNEYQPPQSYAAIKNFYQTVYEDVASIVETHNYAKREIAAIHDHAISLGGFTSRAVSQDVALQDKLSAFINDDRVNSPSAVASTVDRIVNDLAQYDTDYVAILNEIDLALAEAARIRDNANQIAEMIPCAQVQLNYRDAWAAINERYAKQGIFYSSQRDEEVADLTTQYKTDYDLCF